MATKQSEIDIQAKVNLSLTSFCKPAQFWEEVMKERDSLQAYYYFLRRSFFKVINHFILSENLQERLLEHILKKQTRGGKKSDITHHDKIQVLADCLKPEHQFITLGFKSYADLAPYSALKSKYDKELTDEILIQSGLTYEYYLKTLLGIARFVARIDLSSVPVQVWERCKSINN